MEEDQNSLLTSQISSLTRDLIIEEVHELLDDLLMPIIKLKKTRKKKDFDLSGVRRSARFKNKKCFKMSSLKGLFLEF
jgi:hypothetical protein